MVFDNTDLFLLIMELRNVSPSLKVTSLKNGAVAEDSLFCFFFQLKKPEQVVYQHLPIRKRKKKLR